MTEDQIVSDLPTAVKIAGVAGGYLVAGGLYLRQFLSQAKVDRTANDANASTITRLQAQVVIERDRADLFMREREAMAQEIGQLRGEVKALREQIETLRDIITGQRGMQA